MDVKIIDFDHKGRGFGRYEGKSLFLDGGVIGDTVSFEVTESKKKFDIGRITEIIEPSIDRVESKCPYSKKCGGCDFLEYKYSMQKKWKRDNVSATMQKIGGVDTKVEPTIGMENPFYYRNHIQLKVEDGKLGYYAKNSNTLVEVKRCLIAEKEMNKAIDVLRNWKDLKSVDEIVVRQNNVSELMIVLITKTEVKKVNGLLSELLDLNLKSLFINYRKNSRFRFGREFKKVYGEDYIEDELCGFKFRLSAESFFQVNRIQTEKLYKTAVNYMEIKPDDVVMDLYSGIGSISLLMTGAKEVVGVEVVGAAVENARQNSELNGKYNTRFIAGKVEDVIDKLVEEGTRFNKIMLDPPRAGVDESVIEKINELQPERIVYVSCNPSTQAKDLKLFKDYKVEKIQPVDMFCNSVHCECICQLSRVN
ncbi:23S rRNA (uracil1939-C5)-methyltransferase [Peptoniphilus asaccharolyticus DSM 20463]|uniref:23S rRNA (Uracil1939-C5)-methyltransferase n=1 Tax=Peptoniphilus asaccharolyticus DSM 20463 TaxID=573058 RepID=A0A1W1V0F3_PEPAS|nr:23S rRNA (uracil(1939)-C(5))-methyltransferase RlmD [Peptoniphilus asaccharolyticus]MBL7575440.1 23S rRNA (uracil(1939)-C(5))-methyltransferase RlmD [Peptoniphilus asaccharolyticus]SMB86770.1 23S rRNA (uracil1939-C5)-methyltransferase [Peptoniphilus asaccharolyticus DSM 20463]